MKTIQVFLVTCLVSATGFAQNLIPLAAESDRPTIDVESYSIEVTIDPYERELRAIATIRFIQLDRQSYAVFDLDRRLRVRDVFLGEIEPIPVRYRQFDIDSTLEIDLADLGQFDQPYVRIEYDGVLNPEPDRREPILNRVGAETAFLLDEAKWFPTNGVGSDEATMEVHLTAPVGWEVISDLTPLGDPEYLGEVVRNSLVGEEPGFWGTLVVGDYEIVSTSVEDGYDVEAVVLGDSLEAARAMGEAASRIMGFYAETFGPLDSTSLRIVEVDGANWDSRFGAGMLLLPSSGFLADLDEWEFAQYVAAQWFPMMYPIEDPEADAWLAEGMAVFASTYYFEETLDPIDAVEHVRRGLVKALSYEGNLPLSRAGTLSKDSAEYRTLAGFKGGFVFRMLRDVVGDEGFSTMLSQFPTLFADRPLSTDALLDVASTAAGEDLTYFFDQWLNGTGIPEFDREYTIFRTRDGYKVMGLITQDLDLFRMPVELEVMTDGEPEFQIVWVSGPDSDFDIIAERKPLTIRIDPDMRLLRLSPELRVAVHISRGEDLADDGRFNDAIDQYQAAVDEDRLSSLAFFRMGEALFELGNLQAAANVLTEALNGDLEPTWVEAWAYINKGKIYDIRGQRERAVNEYQRAVNTRDDAYGAQAEAEKYLAAPFRRAGRPTIGD